MRSIPSSNSTVLRPPQPQPSLRSAPHRWTITRHTHHTTVQEAPLHAPPPILLWRIDCARDPSKFVTQQQQQQYRFNIRECSSSKKRADEKFYTTRKHLRNERAYREKGVAKLVVPEEVTNYEGAVNTTIVDKFTKRSALRMYSIICRFICIGVGYLTILRRVASLRCAVGSPKRRQLYQTVDSPPPIHPLCCQVSVNLASPQVDFEETIKHVAASPCGAGGSSNSSLHLQTEEVSPDFCAA